MIRLALAGRRPAIPLSLWTALCAVRQRTLEQMNRNRVREIVANLKAMIEP